MIDAVGIVALALVFGILVYSAWPRKKIVRQVVIASSKHSTPEEGSFIMSETEKTETTTTESTEVVAAPVTTDASQAKDAVETTETTTTETTSSDE